MHYYLAALKKYAVFNGRASRAEYWYFVLFTIIASIILSILGGYAGAKWLGMVYALATIIPSLAVCIRRLHDTDHSGWWIFISLIPFVGSIILLVILATDSNAGANKYGPNPKAPTAS